MANKVSSYLKEVKTEMSRVSWPSRQETLRLTAIVIGASVAMAAIVGGLDFIFTKLMEVIIK